jgi:hypothetical protein
MTTAHQLATSGIDVRDPQVTCGLERPRTLQDLIQELLSVGRELGVEGMAFE